MFERYLSKAPKSHPNRYTRFQHKLSGEDAVDESQMKTKQDFPLNLLMLIVSLLLLSVILCQLSYDGFLKAIKAIAFGILAIFFSWEVVYFDSTYPGISPPSPLRVEKSRESFVRAMHTSYLFSIINGVLFTIMIFLWT